MKQRFLSVLDYLPEAHCWRHLVLIALSNWLVVQFSSGGSELKVREQMLNELNVRSDKQPGWLVSLWLCFVYMCSSLLFTAC